MTRTQLNTAAERLRDALTATASPARLQAALTAGLRCIVVPRGLNRHSDFTGAYRVLERIEELTDVLG